MPFPLTIETVFWIAAAVAILAIIDALWLVFMTQKIKRLLGGTQAKDIQEALVVTRKELDKLKSFRNEIDKYLETVEMRLRRSVQGVETVRFNPFKGTGDGGNQSFSTAFLDETGDGVVVSSLYIRERVSIFSKAVKNFNSDFELTDEEREVIENARKKLSNHDR